MVNVTIYIYIPYMDPMGKGCSPAARSRRLCRCARPGTVCFDRVPTLGDGQSVKGLALLTTIRIF